MVCDLGGCRKAVRYERDGGLGREIHDLAVQLLGCVVGWEEGGGGLGVFWVGERWRNGGTGRVGFCLGDLMDRFDGVWTGEGGKGEKGRKESKGGGV